MVETKTFVIEAKIIIHIPLDIIQNKQRTDDVNEGIKKALTKGLYEEGIGFEIQSLTLKAK